MSPGKPLDWLFFFFHQRSSDSTTVAANRTRSTFPFLRGPASIILFHFGADNPTTRYLMLSVSARPNLIMVPPIVPRSSMISDGRTYWVAFTFPPGDFDQSRSLTLSYTHGSQLPPSTLGCAISTNLLKPGFPESKSPTPSQGIDVGSYLSSSSTSNNSHCPRNHSSLSPPHSFVRHR